MIERYHRVLPINIIMKSTSLGLKGVQGSVR
jgi:hypothetical protein